jgi:hypothetical protein
VKQSEYGWTADGWTVVVVDLKQYANIHTNSDGKYVINYFRFDFINSATAADDAFIDIAYMGFCDNLRAVEEYSAKALAVTTDKTSYSAGETVTATVAVKNNPGFNAMPIAITVNGEAVECTSVTAENSSVKVTNDQSIVIDSVGEGDCTTVEGTLITVEFAAPAEAGEYVIGWVVPEGEQIVNANEEEVAFAAKTATITVTE